LYLSASNHSQAPAIVEKPAVLGKTKSGRVTKTTSKTATPKAKKAAAPKKPAVKKATPKKAAA
jgi:histone H1/5